MNNKEAPLKIKVEDGLFIISIGVSTLCYALQHSDLLQDVEIIDQDIFIKDLLIELDQEDEEGATEIHRALDNAANRAVENGAAGVKIKEE